jgi:hypothetical protein
LTLDLVLAFVIGYAATALVEMGRENMAHRKVGITVLYPCDGRASRSEISLPIRFTIP